MLKLYGYRNGRTLRALWALEEVGADYEYVEVDLKRGEAREPWFLAINPAAKVPVLIDAGTVISESAAICMHLGDTYSKSGLMPRLATPARTECYKWTSFVLTELDAPLWTIAKHRFALPVERRVAAVIETAIWEFGIALKILSVRLEEAEYLSGDAFSVADILAGHTLLWAKSAHVLTSGDRLDDYLARLNGREALARARAKTNIVT